MAMALKETYYISHGPPTMCIDESFEANAFLKSWMKTVTGKRPNSILMVSAHWDTIHPTVTFFSGRYPTIYDYGGYSFPDETYKLTYPALGAPDLGRKVKELLMGSGFQRVDEDLERGLDHGAWGPLLLMYPEADIPVCQLSIQSDNDATYHYNLGKALAPLKDQGVLIIGSGTTVHNLNSTSLAPRSPLPTWAVEFDAWLKDALLQGRYDDVVHYLDMAPHHEMAHPTPEHFYPLHVAVGAAGDDAKAKLIHHSWGFGSISYASYGFSTPTTT